MIRIECDDCLRVYKLKPKFAGKRIRCKECGSAISVPSGQQRRQSPPPEEFDFKNEFSDDFGAVVSSGVPTKLPPITAGRKQKKNDTENKSRNRKKPQEEESRFFLIVEACVAALIGIPILILFFIGFGNESIAEGVGLTILSIGILKLVVGGLWLNYVIIDEDPMNKFFLNVVPFYAFYFMYSRFEETKWVAVLWGTGIPVIIIALIYLNTQAPDWR